ncbi:hypothetical protein HI914_04501 [Erysiphe necator]|nr:hypothetical protein HI914_04501 [Erysiphe necator]
MEAPAPVILAICIDSEDGRYFVKRYSSKIRIENVRLSSLWCFIINVVNWPPPVDQFSANKNKPLRIDLEVNLIIQQQVTFMVEI